MIEYLNKFLEKSYREQIFWVLFLIFIFIGTIFYFFIKEIRIKNRAEIIDIQTENTKLTAELNSSGKNIENIEINKHIISEKKEIAEYISKDISNLQLQANAYSNRLKSVINPSDIFNIITGSGFQNLELIKFKIIPGQTSKNILLEKFEIEMNGSYSNIMPYLRGIENSKYFLTIEQLNIIPLKTDKKVKLQDNQVSLKCTINHYRYAHVWNQLKSSVVRTDTSIKENSNKILFFSEKVIDSEFALVNEDTKVIVNEVFKPVINPPAISINGFIEGNKKNYIIVNEKLLSVNDKVDSWTITKITKYKVEFRNSDMTHDIHIANVFNKSRKK